MDKISVTDSALTNAAHLLEQMNERIKEITDKCRDNISEQLNELDLSFRKDIENYLQEVISFRNNLDFCISENIAAIKERILQIPEYEKTKYRKRNII